MNTERRSARTALQSTLTCPACGARTAETMPTDACLVVYDCPACRAVLRPKRGDCCVFCSYGDTPCPPVQAGERAEVRQRTEKERHDDR